MYKRKTVDVYYIMTNYGYGWERECIAYSKAEARRDARTYLENTNASVRIEKHRERIEV